MTIQIERVTEPTPGLVDLIERLGQTNWVNFQADWHLESHILVAYRAGSPAGFLRYVIQTIGDEVDLKPVKLNGKTLIEAKVLAFAVDLEQRRQGIGRKLQLALIEQSKQAGCYQIRSHSATNNHANHQLKLSLGFAVHPVLTTDNQDGYYFVMPLTNLHEFVQNST